MLSLTTINGLPVNNNQDDDDDVVFQPTEAQIEEIDHFLMRRKRHPIMEMREKSRLSNASQGKDNSSPQNSQSRQVIRSITFFNKQKAQEDK